MRLLVLLLLVASAASAAGTKRALVVGVSRDVDGHALPNGGIRAEGDATKVAEALKPFGFGVQTLAGVVTQREFLDALGALTCQTKSQDLLLVYFAGHGDETPDVEPKDETVDHKDEILQFSDGWLNTDALHPAWKTSASGSLIVSFADACHSGSGAWKKALESTERSTQKSTLRTFAEAVLGPPPILIRRAWAPPCAVPSTLSTRILHLGAVGDTGETPAPSSGGFFTRAFLEVVKGGPTSSTYRQLRLDIVSACTRCSAVPPFQFVPAGNGADLLKPFDLP